MADLIIRSIDNEDLRAIDSLAASQGLSRNEFLRREVHELARRPKSAPVTVSELRRSLALTTDLLDDNVMRRIGE